MAGGAQQVAEGVDGAAREPIAAGELRDSQPGVQGEVVVVVVSEVEEEDGTVGFDLPFSVSRNFDLKGRCFKHIRACVDNLLRDRRVKFHLEVARRGGNRICVKRCPAKVVATRGLLTRLSS